MTRAGPTKSSKPSAPTPLLGHRTHQAFLKDHWQKRPLLVRQAVPGFTGLFPGGPAETLKAMQALAARDDAGVGARLVMRDRKKRRWSLHEGPLEADLGAAPARDWTVLVQNLECFVPAARALLQRFSWLPAARIDDVMLSYAVPGGSVGPHEDAYDVFLLQGFGQRRWQIGPGGGAVDDKAPIRLLKDFQPTEEFVLEPGDMLYLPPGVAHFGEAVTTCCTASIGFTAPTHDALLQNYVAYLGQKASALVDDDGIYGDPDLEVPLDPFAVPAALHDETAWLVALLRTDAAELRTFLARLLTGPRPHIPFEPPARPLSLDAFAGRLEREGALALSLPSRGLVIDDEGARQVVLNGEVFDVDAATLRAFRTLLQARTLDLPHRATARALQTVWWPLYQRGELVLTSSRTPR